MVVSFTHLIGYAIAQALQAMPEMNTSFAEVDGKPTLVRPEHVNCGLAIDPKKDDGTRQLVEPNIKLTVDDYARITSLTNPGRSARSTPCRVSCPARARSSTSARWSTPRSTPARPRRRSPASASARS